MQNNLAEKEELEVAEVGEEQAEVVVEQAEEEQEAPVAEEAKSEDELEQYSESVQKRISKLTSKYREEERQRQAAIEYAEAVQKQNQQLRERLTSLDQSYVGEFGSRVEADAAAAKESYRKAYEEGDADGMFEAQQKISRIALEQARYEEAVRRNEERKQQPQEQPQQEPPAWVTDSGGEQGHTPPSEKQMNYLRKLLSSKSEAERDKFMQGLGPNPSKQDVSKAIDQLK